MFLGSMGPTGELSIFIFPSKNDRRLAARWASLPYTCSVPMAVGPELAPQRHNEQPERQGLQVVCATHTMDASK